MNILVVGELSIDVSGSIGLNDNHHLELTGTSNLTNLVKTPTYFKITRGTLLDVLLTNKPNSMVKNTVISPNFLVWKFCGKA